MSSYRKTATKVITFLGGLYFVIEFLLPASALEALGVAPYHDNISYGFIAVGAVSFGLGLINLGVYHGSRVAFVRSGWIHSAALLLGLSVMMTVSLVDWFHSLRIARQVQEITILGEFAAQIYADHEGQVSGVPLLPKRLAALVKAAENVEVSLRAPEASEATKAIGEAQLERFGWALSEVRTALSTGVLTKETQEAFSNTVQDFGAKVGAVLRAQQMQGGTRKLYDFLFQGLFTALGSAMFSLLAVYIAAAAYRAFAVRSFESFLMMLAAVLVILGQTSFGLYISDSFPAIRLWLLEVPNSAAFRAIKIGAGIAGLIMAFRMWFSMESESFSRDVV